jgi:hypothetical protein
MKDDSQKDIKPNLTLPAPSNSNSINSILEREGNSSEDINFALEEADPERINLFEEMEDRTIEEGLREAPIVNTNHGNIIDFSYSILNRVDNILNILDMVLEDAEEAMGITGMGGPIYALTVGTGLLAGGAIGILWSNGEDEAIYAAKAIFLGVLLAGAGAISATKFILNEINQGAGR